MLAEDAPIATAPSPSRLGWVAWGVAGLLLVALAAALALTLFTRKTPVAPVMRFSFAPPFEAQELDVAVSPDGTQIAFDDADRTSDLWLRSGDSFTAQKLTGRGMYPFWSPDGRSLGFISDFGVQRLDFSGGQSWVRSYLRDHGFVQSNDESLAETTARALGITTQELAVCIRPRTPEGAILKVRPALPGGGCASKRDLSRKRDGGGPNPVRPWGLSFSTGHSESRICKRWVGEAVADSQGEGLVRPVPDLQGSGRKGEAWQGFRGLGLKRNAGRTRGPSPRCVSPVRWGMVA
jgi:hypothetical protein